MRVKNTPQRSIQDIDEVTIECTKNEWKSPIESRKCHDYISQTVYEVIICSINFIFCLNLFMIIIFFFLLLLGL